jgi:hypothetical protein
VESCLDITYIFVVEGETSRVPFGILVYPVHELRFIGDVLVSVLSFDFSKILSAYTSSGTFTKKAS